MEYLIVESGSSHLAFDVSQVEAVKAWDPNRGVPVLRAVGLSGEAVCDQSIVCRSTTAQAVEFGIPRARQHRADRATLLRLPRLLTRFRPPRWLVGLLILEAKVALIVDLTRLADEARPLLSYGGST